MRNACTASILNQPNPVTVLSECISLAQKHKNWPKPKHIEIQRSYSSIQRPIVSSAAELLERFSRHRHLSFIFVCCSVACYFDCTVVYKSKLWVAEWQTGSSTDVCPLYALGLLTIGEYQWNWFTVSTLLRPVNWPLEACWKWTVNHSCAVHPYCMLAFQASAMEIWSDVSGSAATTNRLNTMQPLTVKPLQIDTL